MVLFTGLIFWLTVKVNIFGKIKWITNMDIVKRFLKSEIDRVFHLCDVITQDKPLQSEDACVHLGEVESIRKELEHSEKMYGLYGGGLVVLLSVVFAMVVDGWFGKIGGVSGVLFGLYWYFGLVSESQSQQGTLDFVENKLKSILGVKIARME